jgi:hypothetical protein
MSRFATIIGCLLLAGGCGGRSVSIAENNNNDIDGSVTLQDAATPPDAGDRPDGGTVTCEGDDAWELMTVPLSGIVVLNPALGGGGIPQGVTVRVEVSVDFQGCDEMAGVQFEVFGADSLVLLTGYVWRYVGSRDCPFSADTGVERIALHRLAPGTWELLDYMINGPGVPFVVRDCAAAEDCTCDTWQGIPGPWGTACDFDCMCEARLGCVMDGSGGCYQTCSVTSDCPIPLFCNDFLPQTSQGVCLTTGMLDSCESNADCRAGFACIPAPDQGPDWCLPAMDIDHMGTTCAVDCDCPEGFSCVNRPEDEAPTCQIRCRGNLDCPRPTLCDDPGSPGGMNHLICR